MTERAAFRSLKTGQITWFPRNLNLDPSAWVRDDSVQLASDPKPEPMPDPNVLRWETNARPRVVIVADKEGWAFHNIALHVARRLGERFQIRTSFHMRADGTANDIPSGEADAVVSMYWGSHTLVAKKIKAASYLVACYDDHLTITDGKPNPIFERLFSDPRITGIICGNDRIKARMREHVPATWRLWSCPDGVDTEMFRPVPMPKVFTVGWTGNAGRNSDAALQLKGLTQIREAARIAGVPLFIRDVSDPETPPVPQSEMCSAFYSQISCYVCASVCEGTPNPVLEALACGRPVITTRVGVTADAVIDGINGVFIDDREPGTIADAICKVRSWNFMSQNKPDTAAREAAEGVSWDRRVSAWSDVFTELCPVPPSVTRQLPRVDFSDRVTVFLITTGEPTTNAARNALDNQDCRFVLETIENVSPMSAAFQTMLDRCRTPWFIQVDADMILNTNAVRTLAEAAIRKFGDKSASYQVAYPLFDVHLDMPIIGVKIYRADVARKYPYGDVSSCEVDQFARARADGWEVDVLPLRKDLCVGQHGTSYTKKQAFDRYRVLAEKSRLYPWLGWFHEWPRKFAERYRETGNETDLWAFLGSAAGLAVQEPWRGEQDAARRPIHPAYKRFKAMFSEGPKHLNIYATSKCNLRCKFCLRQTGTIGAAPDVTEMTLTPVLNRWPTIKTACIAGFGEPLMHEDLNGLDSFLTSRGIAHSLITNGVLLNDRADDVRRMKLLYVNVSLNATHPAEYESVHGADRFDAVVAGFHAIQGHHRAGFSFVCHADNLTTLPEMIRLSNDHGASFVSLHNILPQPLNDEFRRLVLRSDNPGHVEAIRAAKEVPGANRVTHWPTLIDDDPPGACLSPFQICGVNGHGFMSGCNRVIPPSKDTGHHTNVPDWWHGPQISELRKGLCGDAPINPACAACFGNWSG